MEDAKSARAKSAADRKQLHITKIGERITNLLPADLRASQPTSSLLYRHLAASLLTAPSSARTAHYAAISEPLGRAWNAVANAGLLVSVQDERSLARTFLLCCARAGSSVSALRRGQPGMLLAIVRSAWPTCCSRAAGMPLVPIDRATAEPAVFIDALFHAPIVARIRASVPSCHMGVLQPSGWPKYFEQLCADAAQASGIVTSNNHISQQLWRLRISRPDPLKRFFDAFPLTSPSASTTDPTFVPGYYSTRYWHSDYHTTARNEELIDSFARPLPSAAEAAASVAEADRRLAELVHALECGVTQYVAIERAWAEYTSLSWLPAERRTLVETDTELKGHWLRAVQALPTSDYGHFDADVCHWFWFEKLESADFEGLLLAHRQQAVRKVQRKAQAEAAEAAHTAYLAARMKRRRALEGIF